MPAAEPRVERVNQTIYIYGSAAIRSLIREDIIQRRAVDGRKVGRRMTINLLTTSDGEFTSRVVVAEIPEDKPHAD